MQNRARLSYRIPEMIFHIIALKQWLRKIDSIQLLSDLKVYWSESPTKGCSAFLCLHPLQRILEWSGNFRKEPAHYGGLNLKELVVSIDGEFQSCMSLSNHK